MRNLVWILLLCLPFAAMSQRHYYLSATGSDAALGTSPATAWKTITYLNSQMASNYLPNDTVSFKAGDVFEGGILINIGGSPAGRVVFNTYGSGSKPVITGASDVPLWTQSGDTFIATVTSTVRNFFVNDAEQIIARYPNEHQYLRCDSGKTHYLLDNNLPSVNPNYLDAASVCVHTAQWAWEKSPVDYVSADTLWYQDTVELGALRNYGYFLYGDYHHLDTVREWYYNGVTDKLYYFPGSGIDPNSAECEVSVRDFGMQFGNDVCFVTVDGLAFDKQGSHGIYIPNASCKFNRINGCDFTRQYKHGIQDRGEYDVISNNFFGQIDGIAVIIDGQGSNDTIHHNTFRNIGEFRNSGIGQEINLSAILLAFVDSCHIHHNDIDSAGYCGISADGDHNVIERNVVRNAMLLCNDGAALKSYGQASHHNIFRNNIVYARPGNREGTAQADFRTPGIYFDFAVNNTEVIDNTITGSAERGIFQNSGNHHNTLRGNIVYGAERSLELNGTRAINDTLNNMTIRGNTFFARDPDAVIVYQIDWTNLYQTGNIDSNVYFQPYNSNHYGLRKINGGDVYYDFPTWQSTTGYDATTRSSFVNWTLPTDDSRLFINATDTVATVDLLDSLHLDLDSNLVCGTFTLEPYTSRLLINTMTLCNPTTAPDPVAGRFTAYPNPTAGDLFLRVESNWLGAHYRLLNMVGQEFGSGKIIATEQVISLSELPKGMYLIELQGKTREILRIVRQ
jgi:hypothetical protein